MSSLTLLRLGLLAALVACCSLVEGATNATSHDGDSLFLQLLFDKYGQDGVISYSGFELLLKKVGIVVVSPPGDDRKLSELGHAQAHSQHPAHGHHSNAEETHVIDDHSTGLHEHEHVHSEGNETHSPGEAGTLVEKGRGSREKGGRDDGKGADVAGSVQGSQGQKSRGTRSVGEDDHTKHYLHAGQREKQCLTPRQILSAYHINVKQGITKPDFLHICPAIIYDIEQEACVVSALPRGASDGQSVNNSATSSNGSDSATLTRTFTEIPATVWVYTLLAVAIISLAGLMCVAIIPVMQRCYFDEILHVLVALAVGTLTGDAMLHLLPHALLFGHVSIMPDPSKRYEAHLEGVWKGMTLLLGIYLFFIVERLMEIVFHRRRQRQKSKKTEGLYEVELTAGENTRPTHNRDGADVELVVKRSRDMEDGDDDTDGHGHGHSHGVPDSVSSIAWMVIMGDGLHNFTDGLAIGAAFSSGIPSGFSTTVAVFCHELPHELGDFAVLLRAGMSVKKALFYNVVSSALCLLGAVCGVVVGNVSGMNLWVFAFTAGIFVYLSLVDMVPELISGKKNRKHPVRQLILQLTGSGVGILIMLLIALYERNLKTMFGN